MLAAEKHRATFLAPVAIGLSGALLVLLLVVQSSPSSSSFSIDSLHRPPLRDRLHRLLDQPCSLSRTRHRRSQLPVLLLDLFALPQPFSSAHSYPALLTDSTAGGAIDVVGPFLGSIVATGFYKFVSSCFLCWYRAHLQGLLPSGSSSTCRFVLLRRSNFSSSSTAHTSDASASPQYESVNPDQDKDSLPPKVKAVVDELQAQTGMSEKDAIQKVIGDGPGMVTNAAMAPNVTSMGRGASVMGPGYVALILPLLCRASYFSLISHFCPC